MAKVLIIKLGYSETIDPGISRVPSLGDVLRTTVILSHFASDDVTWLVDEKAAPLLEGNPLIRRVLIYDMTAVLQLSHERFDTVVNLEKVPGLCALADSIPARFRYGFAFDRERGAHLAYDGCENIFSLCREEDLKKANRTSWQELLLNVVGANWEGQEYILGYRPRSVETFDVGLNWAVGAKWSNKAWPANRWKELEGLLGERWSLSSQQGMNDLHEYIEWINSCRLLVTNDSLGLHVALALKKKVVALYGPTNPNETDFYGRGVGLKPSVDWACVPCLAMTCARGELCIATIEPGRVAEAVEELIGGAG